MLNEHQNKTYIMCGITGFINQQSRSDDLSVLKRMTDALHHRGPDSFGYWSGAGGRVHLGHRRLSIIDLTPTGHQPMHTTDQRYVLSYNGEIYNFLELRAELEKTGQRFMGTSDTEVLLVCIARWGVLPTLRRLNGMFAFAVWDSEEEMLYLACDRFGEKPLYYGWQGEVFLFGSELKSLMQHPSFVRELDRDVLALYMRFNYVPAPHCIFKGVAKLCPANFLAVSLRGSQAQPEQYWKLEEVPVDRAVSRLHPEDPALIDMLECSLSRAVKSRMIADVPLGAFLSGGVDSSTVVALMQVHSHRPVKTFTIGFREAAYNEAEDAAKVARHLGTEHHEFYLSSAAALEMIPRLPEIYCEPFADSSQIPTTLVAQLTRRHVTVALSGDGGDELFGGYNRYFWSARIWPRIGDFSPGLRRRGSTMVQHYSPDAWDRFFDRANPLLPARLRIRGGGEKLHKLAGALSSRNPDELYRCLVSQWQSPERVLRGGREPETLLDRPQDVPSSLHFVERMMYLDLLTYLPGDILCKVDRASMSASLESRVAYLDNDVVRLAWSMPLKTKIHQGIGKWPLRQLLKRFMPESLFDRPKTGFGIPIGEWLRGPLREWAENLLSREQLERTGCFQVEVVRQQWAQHQSRQRNLQHALWSVLMFQAWYERYMDTPAVRENRANVAASQIH